MEKAKEGSATQKIKIERRYGNHCSYFVDANGSYERPTYGRYAGSYAQSEMGWSDEDIDTVLDGDPSAYWNID